MVSLTRRLLVLLVALASLGSRAAQADSWIPPHRTTYYSPHRTARLIVTPHFPREEVAPFTGQGRGPSAPDVAHFVLQHREGRRNWTVRSQGRLLNEVAPVQALVADSGRYFVTFDDWGFMGGGPNVVVIYDGAGRTIRALSLVDLVPLDYIRTMMRTFSSIWWTGYAHRIAPDGETLLLNIGIPSLTNPDFSGGGFELRVNLATGTPGRSGPAWDRAMATAEAARVAAQQRQAAQLVYMREPIAAPRSADTQAWFDYLKEAFKRLAPDWNMNNPGIILIQDQHPPMHWSVSYDPRATLLRPNPPVAIMIASPPGLPLAPVLAPIMSGRRTGWLRHERLYIVASDADWPELQRMLGPSGATLVQIDPARPIPQRPERLPPSPATPTP